MNLRSGNDEQSTDSIPKTSVGGARTNDVPRKLFDDNADVTAPPPPRLDEPAPLFEGRSTQGLIRLADYQGKWLVFFSHPADFTPVCASEFVAFEKSRATFATLGCALLGLSIDSVYSHLAWRESIKQHFGVTISFPILDDATGTIAKRYGMCQTTGHATNLVRALYIIDPAGIVRAALWYPVTNGRSVAEVLRLVRALQTSDRQHVVTPEGWQPGHDAVEPPPKTVAAAEETRGASYGCVDWYYYTRPLPHESAAPDQP
jgi:peroxiredoxin (alkyl hydroperoxide reductase subunit C)